MEAMEARGGHLPNKHIDRVMFVNTAAAGEGVDTGQRSTALVTGGKDPQQACELW